MRNPIVSINEVVLVKVRGRYAEGTVVGFSVDGRYVLVDTDYDRPRRASYPTYDVFVKTGSVVAKEAPA